MYSTQKSDDELSVAHIGDATLDVYKALQRLQIPLHIFAGFGLYLHGLDDYVQDGDIRVFTEDLESIFTLLKKELPERNISIRDAKPYTNGTYTNKCIEIDTPYGIGVDICARMTVESDLGTFEFPFTKEVFQDVVSLPYAGTPLQVASMESLLLYYLVLRRGIDNNKDDENRIRHILASPKFNALKFETMLRALPQADSLLALYKTRQTVR